MTIRTPADVWSATTHEPSLGLAGICIPQCRCAWKRSVRASGGRPTETKNLTRAQPWNTNIDKIIRLGGWKIKEGKCEDRHWIRRCAAYRRRCRSNGRKTIMDAQKIRERRKENARIFCRRPCPARPWFSRELSVMFGDDDSRTPSYTLGSKFFSSFISPVCKIEFIVKSNSSCSYAKFIDRMIAVSLCLSGEQTLIRRAVNSLTVISWRYRISEGYATTFIKESWARLFRDGSLFISTWILFLFLWWIFSL